jgi:hypothetical protein
MAKHTPRDGCWKFAFTRAHRKGEPIDDEMLADAVDVSERTARDVLKTMADARILEEKKVGRGTTYVAAEDALERNRSV